MKCDKCLFCNSLSAIAGLDITGVYGSWISRAIAVIHQLCDQTDLIPHSQELAEYEQKQRRTSDG